MTCTIHRFPAQMRADPSANIVTAARAVLRSPLPHRVADIRRACVTMQTFGDGTDYLEAREPSYSPQVTRIRDVLAGALITVSVCYVALVVMLTP